MVHAYKGNKGAVGGFIEKNGTILLSWCIHFGNCSSAEYAEARSIYEGLLRFQHHTTTIHTNSQLLWTKLLNPAADELNKC